MLGAAGREQTFKINGGNNVVIQNQTDTETGASWNDLNKTKKIKVFVQTDCIGTNGPGLTLENAGDYFCIQIIINAGVTVYGNGGAGGVTKNGSPGEAGIQIDSGNSSDIVQLDNLGVIRGGGGGGGAGQDASDSESSFGKECNPPTPCTASCVGGPGGKGRDNTAAGGGSAGTSDSCNTTCNGSGNCIAGTGGNGGNWGTAGSNGGNCIDGSCSSRGIGGAAGPWINGSSRVTINQQGTTSGPTS